MKTSQAGIDLIKNHEGLKLSAYLCPAGVPTIGYGHTGPEVKLGMAISSAQAEAYLAKDLGKFESCINQNVHVILTQNQFNALSSFVYNVGPMAFTGSTLLRKINANAKDPSIKDEFMRWNKSKGVVIPGLITRRMDEANLYFKA